MSETTSERKWFRLYGIRRPRTKKYLRRGRTPDWTDKIEEVRLYARLRDARQRVTTLAGYRLGKLEVVVFKLAGPCAVVLPPARKRS